MFNCFVFNNFFKSIDSWGQNIIAGTTVENKGKLIVFGYLVSSIRNRCSFHCCICFIILFIIESIYIFCRNYFIFSTARDERRKIYLSHHLADDVTLLTKDLNQFYWMGWQCTLEVKVIFYFNSFILHFVYIEHFQRFLKFSFSLFVFCLDDVVLLILVLVLPLLYRFILMYLFLIYF